MKLFCTLSWVIALAGWAHAQETSYVVREWQEGRYVVEDPEAGRVFGLIEDLGVALEANILDGALAERRTSPTNTIDGAAFDLDTLQDDFTPLGDGSPPALFHPATGRAFLFGDDAVVVLDPCAGETITHPLPALRPEHLRGCESAAVGSLRTLGSAQALFREGDRDHDDVLNYGTLKALGESQLVDPRLAAGFKESYLIFCEPCPELPEFLWRAHAIPVLPGARQFATTHMGIVHYLPSGGATYAFPADPSQDAWNAMPAGNPVGR